MRSWSSWVVLTTLAPCSLLLGCPDSGRHSNVRIEFTPACNSTDGVEVGCLQVEVCETDDPDTCLAVAPAGGPYPAPEEDGVTSVLVPVVGGALRFDVRAEIGTLYDIDVVAFGVAEGAAAAVATGHATRVSFDNGTSTVRLTPTDAWTCAPEDATLSLRRAFHQSVPLSNGDVLILGGITFPRSDDGLFLASASAHAGLVPAAEAVLVDDSHNELLYSVTVANDTDGLVSRVLFDARWVERTSPDEQERIRLYGGVTGASTLTFSVSATNQFPLRVSEGAGDMPTLAPTADFLYDPTTRTLTLDVVRYEREVIAESEREDLPRASASTTFGGLVGPEEPAVPESCSDATMCDVGFRCAAETCQPGFEVVTAFASVNSTLGPTVALPAPRRGATLTSFGARRFLVYGGNTTQAAVDQTSERALLLDPSGAVTSAVLPDSLMTSALHTASVIDGETVLFVGGLSLNGLLVQAPPAGSPVVRAYDLADNNSDLVEVPLTGSGESTTERIFHTATLYRAPGASRNSVVVIGGSTRVDGSQFQPLQSGYLVDLDASPQIRALPPLVTARLGHSTALLRGGRVMVTGGLRRGGTAGSVYLVDTVEFLSVRPAPAAVSCQAAAMDAGPLPMDGGRRPDAFVAPADAGVRPDGGEAPDAPATDDAGS